MKKTKEESDESSSSDEAADEWAADKFKNLAGPKFAAKKSCDDLGTGSLGERECYNAFDRDCYNANAGRACYNAFDRDCYDNTDRNCEKSGWCLESCGSRPLNWGKLCEEEVATKCTGW